MEEVDLLSINWAYMISIGTRLKRILPLNACSQRRFSSERLRRKGIRIVSDVIFFPMGSVGGGGVRLDLMDEQDGKHY